MGRKMTEVLVKTQAEFDEAAKNTDNKIIIKDTSEKIVLRGNTHAELWENASVKGFDNAIIQYYSRNNKIKLYGNAHKHKIKDSKYTLDDIKKIAETSNGKIILYKCVNPETNCDFYSGKIEYKIGEEVIAPDFCPAPEIECGKGLHLCLCPSTTQIYNTGKILKCLVNIKDIVVYEKSIQKVRCRAVTPIAVVDIRYGKPGSADFLGICPDGRFLAIECKRPVGGRVSVEQIDFLFDVCKNGGLGIAGRTADESRRKTIQGRASLPVFTSCRRRHTGRATHIAQ
jgi:hypothetical protein